MLSRHPGECCDPHNASRLLNSVDAQPPVAPPATPRHTAKIFGTPADLWTVYDARLAFRDKLIGGIPKDPRLIEGWLRSKAGIDDPQDLRLAVLRTLEEIAGPTSAGPNDDGLVEAAALAAQKRTTGFKVD